MKELCYQLKWHKEGRYYKVLTYKDMLGDWIATCVWGGKQSNLGNYKHYAFKTHDEIALFVDKMKIRRAKRGYFLWNNSESGEATRLLS
jgi:hypothetical protein